MRRRVFLCGELSAEGQFVPDAGGLIWKHAGSADLAIQQSAGGEGVVAHEFGGETESTCARGAGSRIALLQLACCAGLAVGGARR